MFDVGFSEMMVIGVVALVVIGPERMPGVARTVGALFGRAQRYVNDVKADIQREVDLEELKNIQSTFQDAAKSVEQSVSQFGEELQSTGESLNRSIAGAAEDKTAPAAELPANAAAAAETPAVSGQLDLGLESTPAAKTTAESKALN